MRITRRRTHVLSALRSAARALHVWCLATFIALAAVLAIPRALAQDGRDDIRVDASRDGDVVKLSVDMTIDATPMQVWAVLTDYDHMADFLSTISSSKVISRENGVLTVAQTGHSGLGPMTIHFSSVREVRLVPYSEIASDVIEGDIKSSRFVTRLAPVAQGTHIHHEGTYVSTRWIPPLMGPTLIANATHRQYEELRAEMLRRRH